jgi:hypothetical protein
MSEAEAQEQANEYNGFARTGEITGENGEKFTVKNPMFFNAKQHVAYEKLHHRMNKCDRWPDSEKPEQRMSTHQPDGTKVETFVGAYTQRGDYIEPYQEDGVLVDPPYAIQVAQIVLGDEYHKFEDAGGSPWELVEKLAELRRGVQKRVDADPKSDARDGVLAAVPAPDSK